MVLIATKGNLNILCVWYYQLKFVGSLEIGILALTQRTSLWSVSFSLSLSMTMFFLPDEFRRPKSSSSSGT